jgi:CDP-glucose 4,6-dehydratase
MPFADVYRGRRVLVTGHTGFKGSWLTLWLRDLGAKVTGLALPPATTPNHWDLLSLAGDYKLLDIREAASTAAAIEDAQPEIVFHLAAQPLVRRSYKDPLETWSTNVMGTAIVLEACRRLPDLQAIIVVTTDKCYENHEWEWGYRENDRLGGHDPYSASKAGAELVVSSYRDAFFSQQGASLLASARAGNVIGGGDWSEDRLIPDLVRAIASGSPLEIRAPNATRPWQHVLESLSGYLCLGQRLLAGQAEFAQAWNFGPDSGSNLSVQNVLKRLQAHWPALRWQLSAQPGPREANLLYLDSSKAKSKLHWYPTWGVDDALRATAEWYQAYLERQTIISLDQLRQYIASARQQKIEWAE